jgi:hypothetical protein
MKTHTDTTVRLLDGKSLLASWTCDFDKLPTIGERLPVEAGDLRGYRTEAMVSRIDMDLSGHEPVVILDAAPLDSEAKRTVVILNENYVPTALRRDVECHLRSRLDVPAFEWLAGSEGRPIIDIHGPSADARDRAGELNREIRGIISDASSLATA